MAPASGRFVRQNAATEGEYKAFIPDLLPPKHALIAEPRLVDLENEATLALGRLDGGMRLLPDSTLFLYMYVRREAVLSSEIEGTQSTLSDLLLFEQEATPSVPLKDVQEVSAYVRALYRGVERLAELPISMRLLGEIHRILLEDGRGGDKSPGEVRKTQNWIGGSMPGNAYFVPPPPHELGPLLANLEKFVNDEPERTRPLLKAGLAHAQFETIHPFLDGNGRLGRLLITLVLVSEQVMHAPLLYLSLHFKRHKDEYYERLQRVRTHAEWSAWLEFFYRGVATVAKSASDTVQVIRTLFDQDHQAILGSAGRAASNAIRAYEIAKRKAVVSIPALAKELEVSHPTATKAVEKLVSLGILREVTGKARDRQYLYAKYVALR